MDPDDLIDSGDAAVQALLALTAENTDDDQKREKLLDAILTIPVSGWHCMWPIRSISD